MGLLVSLVFTYSIIEMIEEWRIRRSADGIFEKCEITYLLVIGGT